MFAKLIAAAGLVMLAAAVLIAPATAGESPFVEEVTVIDCTVSGRGPGTLVIVPVGPAAEGVVYGIEVDTVGGTLIARRTMLVLEGETFRVTADGAVVASGVGHAPGSVFCGVTPPPPPPPPPPSTTTTITRPPIDGCDDVECIPNGSTTTTTVPDVTTTTRPGFPGTEECPGDQVQIGTDADGNALCEARVASG